MKRIDNNFKLLVAIIIVLGLSLSAMAQQNHRREMPQPSMRAFAGLQILDLTEEQKDQIKEIHQVYMKTVQPSRDEVQINRAKINALLHKEVPDMKEIVSLVEENGKLLTQIQVKSIERKISVRNILTEEQKLKFDAQSEKMGNRRAMAQHFRQRRTPERKRF